MTARRNGILTKPQLLRGILVCESFNYGKYCCIQADVNPQLTGCHCPPNKTHFCIYLHQKIYVIVQNNRDAKPNVNATVEKDIILRLPSSAPWSLPISLRRLSVLPIFLLT